MFNVLGPLINPVHPKGMVLGVAEPALGPIFASSLRDGGLSRALVVCGAEKLDEISCAGYTHTWKLENGQITEQIMHPSDFGLPTHPLHQVGSGTPAENAATFKTLLTSGRDIPATLTPVLDYVLLNASALLVVAGIAADYKEGVSMARESVVSGKAWVALQTFREAGERIAKDATG